VHLFWPCVGCAIGRPALDLPIHAVAACGTNLKHSSEWDGGSGGRNSTRLTMYISSAVTHLCYVLLALCNLIPCPLISANGFCSGLPRLKRRHQTCLTGPRGPSTPSLQRNAAKEESRPPLCISISASSCDIVPCRSLPNTSYFEGGSTYDIGVCIDQRRARLSISLHF
jgi:hypothetical protein